MILMDKNTFGYTFNTTDFELKQVGEEFYVGGFVSVEELDENGDITNQERLLNKLNDPENPYAQYLSYKHKWTKGDKDDFSNALGVKEGDAVMKTHANGKKGVYANYHLLKTSPYYDAAVYDIKNRGVSGFSTEFKEAKRKDVTLGNRIVNYLDDFIFGGVGIVARPAVKSACISGFYAKEIYYNYEDPIETKVDNEGVKKMEAKEEVVETPVVIETPKVEVKPNEDIEKLKQENASLEAELEKAKLEKQKAELVEKLQSLKAQGRVITEVDKVETFETQNPANDRIALLKKEAEAIGNSKDLGTYEKIRQLYELENTKK